MSSLQVPETRPEEGLGRGKYPAPPWLIAAIAAAVILGAVATLVVRARRAKARLQDADKFTPSQRGHRP